MTFVCRFRGIKKINEILSEESKINEDYKKFWKKLFDDYQTPTCPYCKEEMIFESLNIERNITLSWTPGTHPPLQSPENDIIEASFSCPGCGTRIEGMGKGVQFEDKWFTLEEFTVTRIIYRMVTKP